MRVLMMPSWIGSSCLLLWIPLTAGCSAVPRSPTLQNLEAGEVSVFRMKARHDSDAFRVTYVVQAPIEATWDATADIPRWLFQTQLIESVTLVPASASAESERYVLRWSDQSTQIVDVKRDEAKRQIEMIFDLKRTSVGATGECRIRMKQFLGTSTLVRAEVRISNNLANRLAALIVAPIGLLAQLNQDARLKQFWRELVDVHREASIESPDAEGDPTGGVHIIAVGVNEPTQQRWKTLKYAEQDALEFFKLANHLNPRADDMQEIRICLTGSEATDENLGEALMKLRDKRGFVQPGDTIIFFFAGHIELEEPAVETDSPKIAYLITANAKQGNLWKTAFEREVVLEIMRNSRADKCLFICDACYSGGQRVGSLAKLAGMRLRGSRVPDRKEFRRHWQKTVVIAAANKLGRAAELDTLGHGVLTYALLEALSGDADSDSDTYVTLDELKDYLGRAVRDATNGDQEPFVDYPRRMGQLVRWRIP